MGYIGVFTACFITSLMPVFEYKCRQCGHQFEYLVLRLSPPLECPACQKQDLEQLISLCAMSSEATRKANLSAAHAKAASVRTEKERQEHASAHEHFEDHPL
jgi:putative FmdB family regulatory protein